VGAGIVVVVGVEAPGAVVAGFPGPVVVVVGAFGGALGAIGAPTGFRPSADGLTGRRCCPLGPAAEATVPMLIVAANAAEATTRRVTLLLARVDSASRTSRSFVIIPLNSEKGAAGR
jgi:hypothetical protein